LGIASMTSSATSASRSDMKLLPDCCVTQRLGYICCVTQLLHNADTLSDRGVLPV
jgi:hypothetical protein